MARRSSRHRIKVNGLSNLEAEIMQIVWQDGKVTVRDVHETMLGNGYIPYTTVMAAMNNMAQKGLLKQNKNGKAYIYTPAVSKTAVAKDIVDSVVEKISDGSIIPVLSHLLKIKDKKEVEGLVKLREKLYS